MKKIYLAGCVFIKNNEILLIKRTKTGWYELPGGKIEEGEAPEETARREIQEELSANIKIQQKLGSKDFTENGYSMGYTWFQATFLPNAQPTIGEPDKFEELKYIPLNELDKYQLSPNMENFLDKYNKGNITLEK